MLAKTYIDQNVGGWFVSEKLDGMRCLWDGGITIGRRKSEIAWANHYDSNKEAQLCTGLWSRHGNVIHAPSWWVRDLPKVFLDGELFLGHGRFQELMSIVKKYSPNEEDWEKVKYIVFDKPEPETLFMPGRINDHWVIDFVGSSGGCRVFEEKDLGQERLPLRDYQDRISELLDSVTAGGGEGLMLRNPKSYWVPARSGDLLKVKPFETDVGIVVGWIAGRGKYTGMLGSLVVEWAEVEFELSGFNDSQRILTSMGVEWGERNPGKMFPDFINASRIFPRLSRVKFKYRALSDRGIPKEARYND